MSKRIVTGEVERCLISCFFKDPGWLGEIGEHLKPDFFSFVPNQKIFSAIKTLYAETKTLDEHLLISRLNLMGLSSVEGLDVSDYVTSISHMSINLDAKIAYLDELTKFHWSRQTYKKLIQAQKYIETSLENPEINFRDILSGTEKIVTDAMTIESVLGEDESFTDINGDMESLLNEGVGNKDELGLPSPFPIFNRWYGQFMIGGLYVFAASSKVGKSSFLSALTDHFVEIGMKREKGKIRVLFIDTEMTKREVACRKMAAKSGVNAFYYLNGKFAEDKDRLERTQESLPSFKDKAGTIYHHYLPTADIQKIESVSKRFHSKFVGPDDIFVCILDYLKFAGNEDRTAGNGGQALKEYELIGMKTDLMKQLAEKLPRTISITAIQTNRSSEIAQADRVKWYSTGIFSLTRKTPEEIGTEGNKFGSHKLNMIVVRNLGEFADESGPFEVAEGNQTVWVENHINLNFSNFRVTEAGTYKDVIAALGSAGQLTPRQTSSDRNKATYSKYSQKS
jgi:replicative DNA helicase